MKNKESLNSFIYPYREIAKKNYKEPFSFDGIEKIREIKDFCKENGVELVIYYSPVHVSKKIDLYLKKQWNDNLELKRRIAKITPFYDFSLFNQYNSTVLDENNQYYIDNIHPDTLYNNILINDLLSKNSSIGVLLNKDNIEKYLKNDTIALVDFMSKNKNFVQDIKNATIDKAQVFIRRKNAV